MSVSFSIKSKWLLPGRKKVINMLKYDVAGDCLAIKLEGDLKFGQNISEQIQFWNEIEFLPHSLSRFTMLRKNPLPVNNRAQCRMELKDMFS